MMNENEQENQQQSTDPVISFEEAEKMALKAALELQDEWPKDIWVPNRAERRAMKKNAKKGYQNLMNATNFAKGAVLDKEHRQDLYKAAYDKLKNYKTDEYRHQAKG